MAWWFLLLCGFGLGLTVGIAIDGITRYIVWRFAYIGWTGIKELLGIGDTDQPKDAP